MQIIRARAEGEGRDRSGGHGRRAHGEMFEKEEGKGAIMGKGGAMIV
jgi:hypothetical protein